MNWLHKIATNDWEGWFNDKPKNEVRRDPPQTKQIILTLYRGFDADLNKLQKENDHYILSPHKSEQGVIWFSRDEEDALGRGKYLLTYPLSAIKHYQRVYYDNDNFHDEIPQEIVDKTNPYENCPFYGGIELPKGWFFSYKVQKYIVTNQPLKITLDMIKSV